MPAIYKVRINKTHADCGNHFFYAINGERWAPHHHARPAIYSNDLSNSSFWFIYYVRISRSTGYTHTYTGISAERRCWSVSLRCAWRVKIFHFQRFGPFDFESIDNGVLNCWLNLFTPSSGACSGHTSSMRTWQRRGRKKREKFRQSIHGTPSKHQMKMMKI